MCQSRGSYQLNNSSELQLVCKIIARIDYGFRSSLRGTTQFYRIKGRGGLGGRVVGLSGCRVVGLSGCRVVGLSGCRVAWVAWVASDNFLTVKLTLTN